MVVWKEGNRKHSKIDALPPEMKATVEEMILDGSATYSEIVEYLEKNGYSLSTSSVCRYAQGYVESVQALQIAQQNFKNMLEQLDRYPDLEYHRGAGAHCQPEPDERAGQQEG